MTVVSGPPQISVDVPPQTYAPLGSTASISVMVAGTEPLTYQWEFDGNNLTDNTRITGSRSNVLTLADIQAADAGAYQVIVANGLGSVASSVAPLVIVGALPLGFYGNGADWTVNPGGAYTTPIIATNVLTLTDAGGGDNWTTVFFNNPQYVGAFKAAFTYQDVNGALNNGGASFVLQNQGLTAVGGGGGGLGFAGIKFSVAVELNPNTGLGSTMGYSVSTGGATGGYLAPGNVNLGSGDPIDVTVDYTPGRMTLAFTDAVASTSFSTNLTIDVTNAMGSETAYVGFTGADASLHSTQIITNFSFVSIPTEAIQAAATNTAVISWPGEILGYTLQRNSDLTGANWVNVTNLVNNTNGQNQVVVPVGTSKQFYRLILKP